MNGKQRAYQWIKENKLFVLFCLFMAVYYAWHMFYLKPWYDELYTYYSFISRGPVYAAIHWPVPNNHVFYSVLSAFLDWMGNPYIGLRGISFLASMANLCLLYVFAGKFMNRFLAAGCSFLYASVYLVNALSIQGRGYTLATTCYLTALLCLWEICCGRERTRDYVIFALALTAGLYTLVSSTFWVLPVCIAGGIVLLLKKEYKKLFKLVGYSLAAAVMTLFLYTLIWLAIGSNLLSKNPDGIYYGIYQVKIILQAPFEALRTGMEYMLSTPYVQSIPRDRAFFELFAYLTTLFDQYFQSMGAEITVFLGIGWIFSVLLSAYSFRRSKQNYFCGIYLAVTIFMLPLMLIVQSVQPYKRVFSFFAVAFCILISMIFEIFCKTCKEKVQRRLLYGGMVFLFVFSAIMLLSPFYNMQFAGRENDIAEITKEEIKDISSICYMDDFQKYVFKFYYDKEPQELPLQEAEYVLLPKELLEESYTAPVWPILVGNDGVDFACLNERFETVKESEAYILFRKKK